MYKIRHSLKMADAVTSEKVCNGSISADVTSEGSFAKNKIGLSIKNQEGIIVDKGITNDKLACDAITVDRLNIKLVRNSVTVGSIFG
ncbi:hypothetical protein [Bacillus wiedmannii]|uniref:Uncharacterized protein n=1 Tax=Bacillus wiedmannii TaxID=1890302 RepID=A0A2A8BSL6_9BACI|nr:hypothetical protein [Bacillus wiedmannii]PEM57652.1 hypothetical protein CN611_07525 [Bacillus wiedmannii]